jgi:hypothetical protein
MVEGRTIVGEKDKFMVGVLSYDGFGAGSQCGWLTADGCWTTDEVEEAWNPVVERDCWS